jgi:GAF domain-containing protein
MDADAQELIHRPSRLRALAALEPNAVTSARALDRIAATACRLLDAPVVLVNLIDAERQRFVGCGGTDEAGWTAREMPLTHGFCPFTLAAETAFSFADARTEPALAANPVVEQLGVIAYAGVPLRTADGEAIGTLCALDARPHEWSHDDLTLLSDLGASALAELQLLATTWRSARRVRELAHLSSALVGAGSADDVVDRLAPVMDCVHASAVWLLVRGESGRTAAAAAGADREAIAQLPLPEVGSPDHLATRSDVRARIGAVLDASPDIGSVSLLPLTAGDDSRGVLGVCFPDERDLGAEDRGYLTAVAGISSLALARAGV